jgi:hypothetical protein
VKQRVIAAKLNCDICIYSERLDGGDVSCRHPLMRNSLGPAMVRLGLRGQATGHEARLLALMGIELIWGETLLGFPVAYNPAWIVACDHFKEGKCS